MCFFYISVAVITNNTASYAFIDSSFSIDGYMGAIVEITAFNNGGSCSESHSGVRILTSDVQKGYEYDIGASSNTRCNVAWRYGSNADSRSDLKLETCTTPFKCNEVSLQ